MIPAEHYSKCSKKRRRTLREAYVEDQGGLCFYCDAPLSDPPLPSMVKKYPLTTANRARFMLGFFDNPVHLHHDHDTDLTLGAVHAYCNAVLFIYERK
jgi:hypothetical protein